MAIDSRYYCSIDLNPGPFPSKLIQGGLAGAGGAKAPRPPYSPLNPTQGKPAYQKLPHFPFTTAPLRRVTMTPTTSGPFEKHFLDPDIGLSFPSHLISLNFSLFPLIPSISSSSPSKYNFSLFNNLLTLLLYCIFVKITGRSAIRNFSLFLAAFFIQNHCNETPCNDDDEMLTLLKK